MADSPEPGRTNGASPQGDGQPRRRRGPMEVQEVVDELAQETKRTSLLERVEDQLKGKQRYSRLLFVFSLADDRKIHAQIDDEFEAWRKKQDRNRDELTGLLVYTALGAAHFLEGPSELLFGALSLFDSLSGDPAAAAGVAGSAAAADAKPSLIGPVRILHFTEFRGVRASLRWMSMVHGGKMMGGQPTAVDESNCADLAFKVYQKILVMCAKVTETLLKDMPARDPDGDDESGAAPELVIDMGAMQRGYKRIADQLPAVDDIMLMLNKNAADFLFNYAEFEKVFISPFHMVLHSELLWPMAPALAY